MSKVLTTVKKYGEIKKYYVINRQVKHLLAKKLFQDLLSIFKNIHS